MELRYFQIIIPLLMLALTFKQIRDYTQAKATGYETALMIVFWLGILFFSLFPDFFSELIATFFGIKDNINAIIFFGIGILFYFQLQLYKMMKRQDELLTEISRKIALDQVQGK